MMTFGSERAQTTESISRQDRDQALVAAAQAGSAVAFEALHAQYARAIYRVTLSITKNPADAEDVTQDSFMRAYRGLKYFRKEAQFFTWLMRIAVNSAFMLLRKRRRQRELSLQNHSDDNERFIAFDPADARQDPEGFVYLQQTYASVQRSLEALPKSLRIVAELRFLQERSIQEISAVLDISNAATKARLCRARKRMTSKESKVRVRKQPA